MNTLIFRRGTKSDARAIASLHAESWRDAYRGILPDSYLDEEIADERADLWRSRFSSLSSDRFHVVLAESPGGLVGFVCVLLDEDPKWGACLDNLHVLSPWRNRGVGRRLFGMAVQWVMSEEPTWPIHLWVFEANADARRLYDALGGEIAQQHKKEVLKGIEIPSFLYVWHDLQQLLHRLDPKDIFTAEGAEIAESIR
jgi:GNAT superfamily N-acetyltransferase